MSETVLAIWWVWMAAALALAIVEVLAPGFIFLGFAIGAALTGLAVLAGLSVSIPVLFVIFAALSLIAWLVLRKLFRLPGQSPRRFERDIND
jgi:membrane protein implicated in regulation of membrane protease activity